MTLLEMSAAGAVMILVITAVRAVTVNKLPKKTFVVLWETVIARLLIPFYIPAAVSFYTLLNNKHAAGMKITAVPVPDNFTDTGTLINENWDDISGGAGASVKSIDILALIWFIGAVLTALIFTFKYVAAYRKFRFSELVKTGYAKEWLDGQRLRRKAEIRVLGGIISPLTYGVIKPVILLPKGMETEYSDRLEYILAHELAHIKRFDMIRKLFMAAALCVHWFNPAVWIMYLLFNRDIELVCDETVLKTVKNGSRREYAMALIRMEEIKSGFSPLYSHFSKNAAEERITAIMKTKKAGFISCLAACAAVLGITGTFATSAAENPDQNVISDAVILATGGENGETLYSFDRGKTYISAEEYEKLYGKTEVEWWTYDEYKKWLENEKKELQSVLGEKAWTQSDGHFVWTQEKIDETIALYEKTLEQIKNGMKISKTVNGSTEIVLAQGGEGAEMNNASVIASSERFPEYEKHGLIYDAEKRVLIFEGETVGYFKDEYKSGAYVRSFLSGGKTGVEVQRDKDYNITGLKKVDIPEIDESTLAIEYSGTVSYGYFPSQADYYSKEELLEMYGGFGISFDKNGDMLYNGELIRTFIDGYEIESDMWASVYVYYNEKGTVDVTAKREPTKNDDGSTDPSGKLVGLVKATQEEFDSKKFGFLLEDASSEAITVLDPLANPSVFLCYESEGSTFAEIFSKYAMFGIEYKGNDGGIGNVYLNGELVSVFSDVTPEGGAFSFTSKDGGGFNVMTVYDENGKLSGVKKC